MNNKETEQYLVLAPASYWRLFLKLDLEKALLHKMPVKNRIVKCKNTNIVVTNTKRGDPSVTKRFLDIHIDDFKNNRMFDLFQMWISEMLYNVNIGFVFILLHVSYSS